jgi:hypothetical protein
LNPNAKLLFGELTALAKKEGYAWASNNYFANLYQVDPSTISRWIKSLHDAGYIRIELIYNQNKRYIEERRIFLTGLAFEKPIEEISTASLEPDPGGVLQNCNRGIAEMQQGVLQKCNGGIAKMPRRSIQAINTKAAAADQIARKPEKPPPEATADSVSDLKIDDSAETGEKSVNDLKLFFKDLSPLLVFDERFYAKAVSYLSLYALDLKFVSWMYEFCLKKEPKNLPGYFFKIFFEKRYIELYRSQPPPDKKSLFKCPVCSTEHDSDLSTCPLCGLDSSHRHNQEQINFKKRFFDLSPELKDAYGQELESTRHLDFTQRRIQLENLNRKYGLIS